MAKKSTGCPFCGLPREEHHGRDWSMCSRAHKKCDEAGLAAYYKVAKDARTPSGYAKADDAYDRAYNRAREKMLRG